MRRPQKFGPSATFYLTLQAASNYEWQMGQIFVAFSEYQNFIYKISDCSKFRQNVTLCIVARSPLHCVPCLDILHYYYAAVTRILHYLQLEEREIDEEMSSPPSFYVFIYFRNRKFLFVSLCRPLCMTTFVNFL